MERGWRGPQRIGADLIRLYPRWPAPVRVILVPLPQI